MPPANHQTLSTHKTTRHTPRNRFVTQYMRDDPQLTADFNDEGGPTFSTPGSDSTTSKKHLPSTIAAAVFLACFVIFMAIVIAYFLICYKRKHPAVDNPVPPPEKVIVNPNSRGIWSRKKSISPELIIYSGEGGIIHCRQLPPPDLKGILTPSSVSTKQQTDPVPIEESRVLDSFHKGISRFRLPSLRFTQELPSITPPSPVVSTTTPNSRCSPPQFPLARRSYLVNNRVSIVLSDTADTSIDTEGSDDNSVKQERSSVNISNHNQSSPWMTPPDGCEENLSSDTSSQQFSLPDCDSPSGPRTPDLTLNSTSSVSSSNRVLRSFTAPAYIFQGATSPSRADISFADPGSLASNLILQLMKDSGTLLLDEGLPPPAILVSPPTASTLDRRSVTSISPGDVWSHAYKKHNAGSDTSPPEYSIELRNQELPSHPPPRPARSPKRASVQIQKVETTVP